MWLVTFNASKLKLVTFHHRRSETELSPVTVNGCPFQKSLTSIEIRTYNPSQNIKNSGRHVVPLQ